MATYESLGVRRIINASANNSRLGGSCMSAEVLKSMCDAAKHYVDMSELQRKSGDTIARLLDSEAALVTCGAAAGLTLAVAACITRKNTAMMLEMPEAGGSAEVIVQKGQRTGYDQAVRMTGARMVEVGLPASTRPEQIDYAVNGNTAALLYTFSEQTTDLDLVPLDQLIQIGTARAVPVIVDAAVASYPPDRLRQYARMRADLVVVSGAKHIYGPPGTGFVYGNRDLVEACALQAGPEYGLGRPMKVGKEEIVGLVTAFEAYMHRDHDAEQREWEGKVARLVENLGQLPYAHVSRIFPDEVGRPVPRVEIRIEEQAMGATASGIAQRLAQGNQPIRVTSFYLKKGVIVLNPICLQAGDDALIVQGFKNTWKELGRLP